MSDLTPVIDAACQSAPSLDRQTIKRLVYNAAPQPQQRRKLLSHLSAVEAFTSGANDVPPPVARLLRSLADAGAPVRPPGCADCGAVVELVYKRASGRVCRSCGTKSYRAVCSTCGRERRIGARNGDGSATCDSCQVMRRTETCVSCGRHRTVVSRLDSGGALCQACYRRPERECDACGLVRPIKSKKTGQSLCDTCYRAPSGRCSRCGQQQPLSVRGIEGVGAVCINCWRPSEQECSDCGRVRPCKISKNDGKPYCGRCAPRRHVACTRCGRERPVQAHTDIGPVCNSCYDHVAAGLCRGCGASTRIYANGRCHRCVLERELETSLPLEKLAPVRSALLTGRSPQAALRWLTNSSGGALLRRIGGGEIELSHEALDDLGLDKRHADYVRQLLVATEVLPDRGEVAERLALWLDGFVKDLPAPHARIIKPFGEWHILRGVRRQDQRGRLTDSGAKWARQRVRCAASLLAWVDAKGTDLATLSQLDLDEWLAEGPTTRYSVRSFLRWAADRGQAPKLSVPLRQTLSGAEHAEDTERWALVETLLNDDDVSLDLRVAGLLVLLYGQHLSRIVRIRLEHVEPGPPTTVALGSTPLQLIEPLDDLLLQLAAQPVGHLAPAVTSPWLYPGGHAGQHITAEQLRKRLEAETGIRARATRNTAMLHLAREIPVPVLADLLGLHFNTAVEWVQLARGDWSTYVANRSTTEYSR